MKESLFFDILNTMSFADYIAAEPNICYGKPCFKNARIMVYLVLELLEAGVPIEEIIGTNYYPQLTRKHIEAALHYASQLLKTREYASQNAFR
ncbi:MAG: DUF433 domain-containing protein [Thermodesulfobacteriota bacterium]